MEDRWKIVAKALTEPCGMGWLKKKFIGGLVCV